MLVALSFIQHPNQARNKGFFLPTQSEKQRDGLWLPWLCLTPQANGCGLGSEELWPRKPLSCSHPRGQLLQMQRNSVGMGTWPLGYQYHSDLSIRNEKRNMPHHTKASMSVRCLFRLQGKRKPRRDWVTLILPKETMCFLWVLFSH